MQLPWLWWGLLDSDGNLTSVRVLFIAINCMRCHTVIQLITYKASCHNDHCGGNELELHSFDLMKHKYCIDNTLMMEMLTISVLAAMIPVSLAVFITKKVGLDNGNSLVVQPQLVSVPLTGACYSKPGWHGLALLMFQLILVLDSLFRLLYINLI